MQKHICIDARMIGAKGHGIALYVEELARALLEDFADTSNITFLITEDCPADSPVRSFRTHTCTAPFLSLKELWQLPKIIRALEVDLFISPSFSSLVRYPCPYAFVLHDLNHLHFGDFKQKLYYRFLVKPAARRANHLLTVSQSSQTEIARWLGIPEHKILIAPNAVAVPPPPIHAALGNLNSGQFFIGIGTHKTHKNINTLLAAYQLYRSTSPRPWPLAITLATGEITNQAPGVKALGNIPYSQLMGLLSQCGGFLMPSLYEGFSRSPVEALMVGAPVVVSDILAHKEVLKDAPNVEFVRCQDVQAWANAMTRLEQKQILPPTHATQALYRERFSRKNQLAPLLPLLLSNK